MSALIYRKKTVNEITIIFVVITKYASNNHINYKYFSTSH